MSLGQEVALNRLAKRLKSKEWSTALHHSIYCQDTYVLTYWRKIASMHTAQNRTCLWLLDAIADFRQTSDKGELWAALHRHLSRFGITGVMYGSEAFFDLDKKPDIFLCSYDQSYMEIKMSRGLFLCDEYVRASKIETAPVLWSDTSRLENLNLQARRSVELDVDYGIVTGVTLPTLINNGFGRSGFGFHAANMSWEEFDRLWLENQNVISAIAMAFDVRLREAHAGEVFSLTPRERECLLWLAHGLQQQQIAHRLGTHMKTVEKQIRSARRKLNATTATQALGNALIYGLIAP